MTGWNMPHNQDSALTASTSQTQTNWNRPHNHNPDEVVAACIGSILRFFWVFKSHAVSGITYNVPATDFLIKAYDQYMRCSYETDQNNDAEDDQKSRAYNNGF